MNSSSRSNPPSARTLPVALLLGALAAGRLFGAETASLPAAEPVPLTTEQTVALQALDHDIARLDQNVSRVTDPAFRATTEGFIAGFKQTREALRRTFDQTRYDEVKFEAVDEYQRLRLWLSTTAAPPLPARPPAAEPIVFRLSPSPDQPAEIKAALAALDEEIRRRERGPKPPEISPAAVPEARKSLREHRAALGRKFTSLGWEAALAELKRRPAP